MSWRPIEELIVAQGYCRVNIFHCGWRCQSWTGGGRYQDRETTTRKSAEGRHQSS